MLNRAKGHFNSKRRKKGSKCPLAAVLSSKCTGHLFLHRALNNQDNLLKKIQFSQLVNNCVVYPTKTFPKKAAQIFKKCVFCSLPGNSQQRSTRDKTSFLRFGRSTNEDNKKKRDKRQATASADALKRHENYLRFGRTASSNFMRFGRNLGAQPEEELLRPNLESRNRHLLDYLKSLLRQSDGRVSHIN